MNKGININHQDKMGWTPLHFCAQYDNITIAELLLQEGAKLQKKRDRGITTIL